MTSSPPSDPSPAVDDIRRRIAAVLELPESKVAAETDLADLVADSFRLVEMSIEIQDDYDVIFGQQDLAAVHTVGDLAALIRDRLAASGR